MSNNFPSYPSNNGGSGDNPYNAYNDDAQGAAGYGNQGYGNDQYGNAGNQAYGAFPTNDYNQAPMHGSERPGVGKRFLGYLIDSILLSIVVGILVVVLVGTDRIVNMTNSGTPDMGITAMIGLIGLVLWFAYRVGMETTQGATLGKMAVGARVTMEDGSPVTAQASFLRNSWYLISQLVNMIPLIGFLLSLAVYIAVGVTIGRDPGNQSFSDKWGKAIVVDKH